MYPKSISNSGGEVFKSDVDNDSLYKFLTDQGLTTFKHAAEEDSQVETVRRARSHSEFW